jgi:transcriptional regulator with XRE-family HTH domain
MARLVGLESAAEVERIERGESEPAFAVLKRYATVFGARLARFVGGNVSASPAMLLFRSAAEHGADLSSVLGTRDFQLLGSFLACVSDLHELEHLLGDPPADVPKLQSHDLTDPAWPQGQEFATRAREALGLGVQPIPSMRSLLEDRLHWSLFFVTPNDLSSDLRGASTLLPSPAILVNLVKGRENWGSTRMTLAHEMCHLLYDARTNARPYLISPQGELQGRREWAIVERFRGLESRANAFAAHFLAPSAALRDVVGNRAPDSPDAIEAVHATFGISREVAIHRLGHEYPLSLEAQNRMLSGISAATYAKDHPDARIEPGLRRGKLACLVQRALNASLIGGVHARAILDIPLSEPLPGAGPGRAPLITKEQVARSKAEMYARASGERDCWSSEARRTKQGWEVVLHYPRPTGTVTRTMRLTDGFEPLPA